MEQMFMRDGNHALLGALAKLLQTMSSLQSSVEDSVQAQQQYTRILYIRRVAMDDLQFRRKRAIRAGYYDYAEPKTSRGPPLRKCAQLSSISFIERFPGSAGHPSVRCRGYLRQNMAKTDMARHPRGN